MGRGARGEGRGAGSQQALMSADAVGGGRVQVLLALLLSENLVRMQDPEQRHKLA